MKDPKNAILYILLLVVNCSTSNQDFKNGYVTSEGGVQLYYCIAGSSPDTVIVPAATYLKHDLKRLSTQHTIIFYDPRNRGLSQAVRDTTKLGIEFELVDLEYICRHFKLKNSSLIGWSYLGAVVALYAAENPEQVNRIIQIGPFPPRKLYWEQFEANYSEKLNTAGLGCLQDLRDLIKDKVSPSAYGELFARIRAEAMLAKPENYDLFNRDYLKLENESLENSDFTVSRILASLRDWDWRERMSCVLMPVLVIQGEQDPLPIASAQEWADIFPNGRLCLIASAGHLPFVERPDLFYPMVERFLGGKEP